MAKLTNKQLSSIDGAIDKLFRLQAFLMRNDIEICTRMLPNALSYYDKDGKALTPLNKQIGSDLVFLQAALEDLHFLRKS